MLESLEVDGFRGFLDAFELPVRGRATLLLGGQGTGKTSCLGAIEWCLFGELAYFKSAESKTDLELVNSHKLDEACRVRLVLRKGDEYFEIERMKDARTRDTELVVRSNGQESHGSEAQQKIFVTLDLTFNDFIRAVYLHQEAIRGLITDDPKQRDEAIDRLLGLDTARNLLSGIPLKDVRNAIDELTEKKEKLEMKIAGATTQVQSEVVKAEEEAAAEGLEDNDLSLDYARCLVDDLGGQLSNLAMENQLERVESPSAVDLPSLVKAVTKARAFAKDCRKRIIQVTNVDSFRQRRNSVTELKEGLEGLAVSLNQLTKESELIKKAWGDRKKIEKSIEEENAKIAELDSRRSRFDALSRLAGDALSLFGSNPLMVCPVCEQPITPGEVEAHLKELLEESKQRQIDEIDEGVKASKGRIQELREASDELDRLESKASGLRAKQVDLSTAANEILGEEISMDLVLNRLDREIEAIKEELKKAEQAYERRNEQIEKAEFIASQIRIIHKVLEKRQEFKALSERFSAESSEIGGLRDAIGNLSKFQHGLEDIVNAVVAIQVELAEQSVNNGSEEMEKIYATLHAHPYYSKLKIVVSTKASSGTAKNTYLIRAFNPKDGKATFVSGRFSTGQMNCAALSIFLALAKIASHNLGFVIFDDPSQNLDSHHKGALSEVLEEIAREKQLIVGTQDEEFQEMLRKVFKPGVKTVIAEFGEWGKKGPAITLSS